MSWYDWVPLVLVPFGLWATFGLLALLLLAIDEDHL